MPEIGELVTAALNHSKLSEGESKLTKGAQAMGDLHLPGEPRPTSAQWDMLQLLRTRGPFADHELHRGTLNALARRGWVCRTKTGYFKISTKGLAALGASGVGKVRTESEE